MRFRPPPPPHACARLRTPAHACAHALLPHSQRTPRSPRRYDLVDDDFCIVIASDGVWELLGSQTVADIIASVKSGDVQDMCDTIVDQSSYMWKVEEGDYRDDITVIILMLPWVPPEAAAAS